MSARRFCFDVCRLQVIPRSLSVWCMMQKKTAREKSPPKILKAWKAQSCTRSHIFLLTIFFHVTHDKLSERGTAHSLWFITKFSELTEMFGNQNYNLGWKVNKSREINNEWKPGFFGSVCWCKMFLWALYNFLLLASFCRKLKTIFPLVVTWKS